MAVVLMTKYLQCDYHDDNISVGEKTEDKRLEYNKFSTVPLPLCCGDMW